jgi:hypothetical protein
MLKKMKNYVVAIAMIAGFAAPALVPVAVSADIQNQLCTGTNLATGDSGTGCNDGTANNAGLGEIAAKLVNFLSLIVGIISVIMIIFGGFRYITSGGESGNVSGAKNTLIYAIVGLVIVALAQFIVHFVLNTTSQATTGS